MRNDKKHGRKISARKVLAAVFLCVFLFALWKVGSILLEYRDIDKLYEDTAAEYTTDVMDNLDEATSGPIDVDLESLREENDDVIGWIYIPDTNVNFPLLQGEDNEQYLYQSYEKEYLTAGSIFLDYRCSDDFSDGNTVIYGHNMHNGSMFGKLKKYASEDYRDAHPYIYIMKADGSWNKYEVIAYFVADVMGPVYELPLAASSAADAASGELTGASMTSEFRELAQTIADSNAYSGDVELAPGDKLITLSTCTQDSRNDARNVLIARLLAE